MLGAFHVKSTEYKLFCTAEYVKFKYGLSGSPNINTLDSSVSVLPIILNTDKYTLYKVLAVRPVNV